ncbi:MAG: methyltransferase domain-containing protein [Syntrophaceae bacterium]|nr:methyltransferase domain-containing protein [Syntrophaceae bacterium]
MSKENKLFDDWPERYDQWFTTPIGALVKKYESELILDLLKPAPQETILDAGCGTGLFTLDLLSRGSHLVGLDISLPMLRRAAEKTKGYPFQPVLADMVNLPFQDSTFDKVVSVTALEFVGDAKAAVSELFRVTRKGGWIVVATLNSLSAWARRRKAAAEKGHSLFKRAIFRSPDELRSLAAPPGVIRTAIHFQKDDDPDHAHELEREGQGRGLDTGAFVAVRWEKPWEDKS